MDTDTVEVTVAKGHTIHAGTGEDGARKHHGPGSKLRVSAREAEQLLARGVVMPPPAPAAAPAESATVGDEVADDEPSITTIDGKGAKITRSARRKAD